jgi:hypothetical protein
MAFDANSAAGRAIYAMALAAKATGSTITVQGKGRCDAFQAYVEDWDYGVMSD